MENVATRNGFEKGGRESERGDRDAFFLRRRKTVSLIVDRYPSRNNRDNEKATQPKSFALSRSAPHLDFVSPAFAGDNSRRSVELLALSVPGLRPHNPRYSFCLAGFAICIDRAAGSDGLDWASNRAIGELLSSLRESAARPARNRLSAGGDVANRRLNKGSFPVRTLRAVEAELGHRGKRSRDDCPMKP